MQTEGKVETEKKLLRSRFAQMRESVLPADRQRMSLQISDHLVQYMAGQDSQTIALYAAMRAEVDLSTCLKRLQAQKHRIVYPKTDKQTKRLLFYQVRDLKDFIVGNYGIYEPVSSKDNFVSNAQIDIVCVPGLAFTGNGVRLGYGGGFYDRLFENDTIRPKRVGIAYCIQVTESLPESPHDSRMDYLLTEEGWRACED